VRAVVRPRRRGAGGLATLAAAMVVAGCTGGPILANPPLAYPSPPTATAGPTHGPDPVLLEFPRDDGPHDRLSEWWYYTGHLRTEAGRRFGFEAVTFRIERGAVSPAWASHLALTDEGGQTFHYAQRTEFGPQVDRSPRDGDGAPTGFDLNVAGLSPTLIAAGAPPLAASPWRLAGSDGTDHIDAVLTPEEAASAGAGFGLRLDLRSTRAPALHRGFGFVDFGPAGSSYYYSRTRLDASGSLELDGETLAVTGIAWFDHQWGDFISVGGGWNWFAVNLDDGTDLMISEVHDDQGNVVLGYGTLVSPSGRVTHVDPQTYFVGQSSQWASSTTGYLYPSGWDIGLFSFSIHLEPTVLDQELDTRATTGIVYWEGSHTVVGTDRLGTEQTGAAYVEITHYEP
jgi:predicted secreted hydrolase